MGSGDSPQVVRLVQQTLHSLSHLSRPGNSGDFIILIYNNCRAQGDGSGRKVPATKPADLCAPQHLQGGRRDVTPASCPGTSTCAVVHTYIHVHTHRDSIPGLGIKIAM